MRASELGVVAFALLACACGSEGGSPGAGGSAGSGQGGSGQGGAGGSGANEPGCSVAPQCGTCDTCYQRCYCETQSDTCIDACSPDGPGTGGSSGAGSGGTAGSAGSGTGGSAGSTGSGATGGTAGSDGSGATGGTDATGGASGSAGTGGVGTGGAGGSGGATFQIQTTPFTLQPGQEAFMCQNFANPFPADVGVVQSESYMTPGSHHMFVFYRDGATDGGLAGCSGLEFTSYVHSAQTPEQIIRYPAGIGRTVRKSQGLRILMHYLNASSQPLNAQVTVRFHTVAPSELTHEAGPLFFNNIGLRIPPGAGSATQTCTLRSGISLLGAVSHMHKFATRFTSTTNTGVSIYEGTDWDEPMPREFSPALELASGTRITTTCQYNNTTNNTLTFGESASTNEMCILSGTYYPAPGGAVLGCQ